MTVTAAEQYNIELINRARLDPQGEAKRFGLDDANDGLPQGTIPDGPVQPLAHNDVIAQAATAHSQWMLDNNKFSHEGPGGNSFIDRMAAAGYNVNAMRWGGENLAFYGTTGPIDLNLAAGQHHENLFLSVDHRPNMLDARFREIGVGQVEGQFTQDGTTFNTSMMTHNFAVSGNAVFLLGVAYDDLDGNDFYSIGEARAGVTFTIGANSTDTQAAGGYQMSVGPGARRQVTIDDNGQMSVVQIDLTTQNAKLDLVNGDTLLTSADLTLVSGVADARALGVGDIDLTGNGSDNRLTGNAGQNELVGGAGNDTLDGGAGNDVLRDGAGIDVLRGGAGADVFRMARDGQDDRILDFDITQDTLSLSAFGKLDVNDVQVQTTADGAVLIVGGERFILTSADGTPLTADQILTDSVILGLIETPDPSPSTPGPEFDPTPGPDAFTGSDDHDDMIPGLGGNDTLTGLGGDDTLNGGAGADHLDGGPGTDTASYDGSTSSLRIDLLFPQVNTNVARGDTYDSIENVIGSQGQDNIRGTFGDNLIQGMGNVDYLYGRLGDDTLEGGIGNDVLFGGPGADLLIGGEHRDRAQYSESRDDLRVDLALPDTNTGEAAGDVYDSIEDLAGGFGNDTLFGDGGDNGLYGREGDDRLVGRFGDDYLNGGSGADRFEGGQGNDTMRGGFGVDTFVFTEGQDVIEDYNVAQRETLELDDALWGNEDLTKSQIVNRFAEVTDDGVLFDFGNGNTLLLEDLISLDGLDLNITTF